MVVFPCNVCKTSLSADEAQAGQLVRCPTCLSTLRVPGGSVSRPPELIAAPAGAAASTEARGAPSLRPPMLMAPPSGRAGVKRYGFNCGYCSSRLEANDATGGQDGQCPTCGNNITIPILDRYGRLIDPKTRQIIKQDPHPVHAYAAAGERAPRIQRQRDGRQFICCARCNGMSVITANNCKACGMPFTMEGTTLEAAGSSNSLCVASLVLGIIGLLPGCGIIPAILALIFGFIGFNQSKRATGERSGKGLAIAGMVLGGLGCIISFALFIGF